MSANEIPASQVLTNPENLKRLSEQKVEWIRPSTENSKYRKRRYGMIVYEIAIQKHVNYKLLQVALRPSLMDPCLLCLHPMDSCKRPQKKYDDIQMLQLSSN